MVVISILPHAEFGRNDHREDVPHFSYHSLRNIRYALQQIHNA